MHLVISNRIKQPLSVTADVETIYYDIAECTLGRILVARSRKGICSILFGDDREVLKEDLALRFSNAKLMAIRDAVQDDLATVIGFVDRPAKGLHLKLDMRGTSFRRRVWEKIHTIPVGKTVTYRELAHWISPFATPLAVAGACAANPIALAIPCHRVFGRDGDLAGYRWGVERRRRLIEIEARA